MKVDVILHWEKQIKPKIKKEKLILEKKGKQRNTKIHTGKKINIERRKTEYQKKVKINRKNYILEEEQEKLKWIKKERQDTKTEKLDTVRKERYRKRVKLLPFGRIGDREKET